MNMEMLQLAESAALLAGHALKDQRNTWAGIENASGHDVKIKADRMAEEMIVNLLQRGSDHPILSEEAGLIGDGAGRGRRWIVDPLDGSLNYHLGIPMCCVSIALYDDLEPILGVVYDFNHDALFSGQVAAGAWLNHVPMQPSATTEIAAAVLGTGFPVKSDFSMEGLTRLIGNIQGYRKIRWLGSAALSLCYVACGKMDVYQEENIRLWDVAGGCALVRAAGGVVTMKEINLAEHRFHVTAQNGRLNVI